MSNVVQVFNFNGQGDVRVVVDGQEWFVGADVCRILGLGAESPRMTLRLLPERMRTRWSKLTENSILGHKIHPETILVNEAGLYRLIMRSRKPEAEAFQNWIAEEVLPTIRRTGRYEVPGRAMTAGEEIMSPLADGIVKVMNRVGEELVALRVLLESVKRDTQPVRVLTVSEFLRERGIVLDPEGRKELGGVAKKLSTERGFPENRTAPSKLYPRGVNKYRLDVLEEVIDEHLACA